MDIKYLKERPDLDRNSRLGKRFDQFEKLIAALRTKRLKEEVVLAINSRIAAMDAIPHMDKSFSRELRNAQSSILRDVEKQHKIASRNHYRNRWLAMGIGGIGIPLGVVIGSVIGNMAFIGVGIPIGFCIGVAVGSMMDNKLKDQGRQLDLEIKY